MERAQNAKLVLETRDRLGIGGALGLEHLGRADGTGARVVNAKHIRGRARTEGGENLVAASKDRKRALH
jgi:hypothetical protein